MGSVVFGFIHQLNEVHRQGMITKLHNKPAHDLVRGFLRGAT